MARLLKYNPTDCYHCGKKIETAKEHVIKPVQLDKSGGSVLVNRDFHISCARSFQVSYELEKKEQDENEWFRKAHDKLADMTGVGGTYLAMRIKGLRVDEYIPKGTNTIGVDRGYSYESIYNTILFCTQKIHTAIRTKKFSDEKHLVNYVMYILKDNVAFIDKRTKNRVVSDRTIEKTFEKVRIQTEEDYDNFVPVEDEKAKALSDALNNREEDDDDDLDFDNMFK